MLIFGLDISTKLTGYAVLDWQGSVPTSTPLELGSITSKHTDPRDRVAEMADEIAALIREVLRSRPARRTPEDVVAIEDGAAWNSRATTRLLAECRGAAVAHAQAFRLRYWLAMPSRWRKLALGNGHASKTDAAMLMSKLWGYKNATLPLDKWEALGVATACGLTEGQ